MVSKTKFFMPITLILLDAEIQIEFIIAEEIIILEMHNPWWRHMWLKCKQMIQFVCV